MKYKLKYILLYVVMVINLKELSILKAYQFCPITLSVEVKYYKRSAYNGLSTSDKTGVN